MTASSIVGVLARVCVDDIEAVLPLYRDLADGAEPQRFGFGDVRLARVGPFLLIEGADEQIRGRAATLLVTDIEQIAATLVDSGGELLDGPAPGPNGARLIARHPDGSVWEYIEQS